MKIKHSILLSAVALGASAVLSLAQDAPPPANDQAAPPPPPRRGGGPLFAALDTNHDGVLDEKEIANASAALKALDKNGDGKITMDEVRPAGGRGGRGPGGPGGKGGPGAANSTDKKGGG